MGSIPCLTECDLGCKFKRYVPRLFDGSVHDKRVRSFVYPVAAKKQWLGERRAHQSSARLMSMTPTGDLGRGVKVRTVLKARSACERERAGPRVGRHPGLSAVPQSFRIGGPRRSTDGPRDRQGEKGHDCTLECADLDMRGGAGVTRSNRISYDLGKYLPPMEFCICYVNWPESLDFGALRQFFSGSGCDVRLCFPVESGRFGGFSDRCQAAQGQGGKR
jgi:hypothetical protein